jgi:hypothetical protein
MISTLNFKTLPIKAALQMLPALVLIGLSSTMAAPAQSRDHLTDSESELVRYYQEIDKRTDVFIKAADRRFAIINGTALPSTKKLMKDEPDWGEPPKGTRAELLGDVAGILDEAITNIDDASSKNAKNAQVGKALRKLSAAVTGYVNQLAAWKSKTTDADELAAMERINDYTSQIIEANGKLPPPAPEETKKKKP